MNDRVLWKACQRPGSPEEFGHELCRSSSEEKWGFAMSPSSPRDTSNMRSLDRAITVVEALEEAGRPLKLVEISRVTGLHNATVQRILNALESRGRVERDGREYRSGASAVYGAHAYLTTSPLVERAQPVLSELAQRTSLTASLFVRAGWSRVVVARVPGAKPLAYELPMGSRLPLHRGAGKIFAAEFSTEQLTLYIEQVAPAEMGGESDEWGAQLRAELNEIRVQGYHIARGERIAGAMSISVPVRDRSAAVRASITVGAEARDVAEDAEPELLAEVKRAAEAVRLS